MLIVLSPGDGGELPVVAEHEPVEFVCAAPPGGRLSLAVDGRALDAFLRPDDPAWRWRWNPGPAVGLRSLRLAITSRDETSAFTWELRVAPAKIDAERYALLLEDIQRIAASLAYAFGGAGAEGATPQQAPDRPGALETYYTLLTGRLDALEHAARRIIARPREHLRPGERAVPLGDAGAPSADALDRIARGQLDPAPPDAAPALQEAIRPGGGLLPHTIPTSAAHVTTDTYEHRLLRRVLELTAGRARRIGALAERDAARLARVEAAGAAARRDRALAIGQGCADALARVRELLAAPPVAGAGPLAFRGPTPLLQRDPHYRAVYRAWLDLRRTPLITFDTPLLDLPIADLPQLYECWCALRAAEALLALGPVRSQRLVAAKGDPSDPESLDITVGLAEDAPLLVVARGDLELRLRYQARYRPARQAREGRGTEGEGFGALGSLDRFTRVPDLAVEVWRPGAPPRVIVLDAKYRLEGDAGVPQDAFADAYAYLGSVGEGAAPAAAAAGLLYPGDGAARVYPSGVAEIPLLPGREDVLAALLAGWIDAQSYRTPRAPQ